MFRWQQQVATALPDDGDPATAQTSIVVNGLGAPLDYQITVSWVEPTEPQPLSYVLRMQI